MSLLQPRPISIALYRNILLRVQCRFNSIVRIFVTIIKSAHSDTPSPLARKPMVFCCTSTLVLRCVLLWFYKWLWRVRSKRNISLLNGMHHPIQLLWCMLHIRHVRFFQRVEEFSCIHTDQLPVFRGGVGVDQKNRKDSTRSASGRSTTAVGMVYSLYQKHKGNLVENDTANDDVHAGKSALGQPFSRLKQKVGST